MLIDERTRLRIVIVVWVCFMIGALGIKNWVIAILIIGGVVAMMALWWARWDAIREATEGARQAKRDALWERMQTQHQQAVTGDERGVFGVGYDDHVAFTEAARPRMPAHEFTAVEAFHVTGRGMAYKVDVGEHPPFVGEPIVLDGRPCRVTAVDFPGAGGAVVIFVDDKRPRPKPGKGVTW